LTIQSKWKPARIGRRLAVVLIGFVCALALFTAALTLVQIYATRRERAAYPAPGKMVDVHGARMHVYQEGKGDKTFVLLGGGGVGAPVLEYRPLWSRLARHGRVAVVEYPGYGWSDDSGAIRTSEKIVEEIRAALNGAGVTPPYVLVAHSLGGIYATAYAQRYPDELEAIIALDTTLPRAFAEAIKHGQNPEQATPQLAPVALMRKLGVLRLLLAFDPLLVSGAPQGVYSDAEARQIATVTGWNYASDAMLHEFQALPDNLNALADAEFPKSLPILMIQASPPGDVAESQAWSLSERKRLVGPLDHGKVIELPAGHSGIYWTLSDDIVREALAFLSEST
jgi:pimeloyl-ACP methyl ester carboxylesterase